MAVLNFNGYTVKEMNYTKNDNFKNDSEIALKPKLKFNNQIKNDKIVVEISASIGSLKDNRIPFKASCSLEGTFEYISSEDESNIGPDSLIRNNAVAILYPYLRATISNLTSQSNEFPAYILPTVNVAKLLKNND
ncbi:protein-export chaperone SecB [Companilactobacillus sp. HBUAS56257]|jgi:preprotein translocase subunit SecB|uniref:protein-export chaperone SecB n=1 Tax=Companilactobacillus sp. HBUAS56257 TaxID=3109360 RepID=UPI002FF0A38C